MNNPNSALESSDRRSLHPLSLLFDIGSRIRENLIPALFAGFSVATGGMIGLYVGFSIFAIAISFSIVRFFTYRYTLTDSELQIDYGLLFRTHRSIPVDRIQNIDSVQNLFHRLFGVAEVKIETASGSEPEAVMRVLGMEEIARLRNRLLTHTEPYNPASDGLSTVSILDETTTENTAEPTSLPSETLVLELPLRVLLQAGLLSNRGQVLAAVLIGYLFQTNSFSGDWWTGKVNSEQRAYWRNRMREFWSSAVQQSESLGFGNGFWRSALLLLGVLLVLLLLFRLFSMAWFVLKFLGYRLTSRGDELHVQCGLLTRVSATIPRRRIQVISVHRGWVARLCGLASIRLETSGGGMGSEAEDASQTIGRRWFVPILKEADLNCVLRSIDPELRWDLPSIDWVPLASNAGWRMIRSLWITTALLLGFVGVIAAFLDWRWMAWGGAIAAVFLVSGTLLARKRARSRKFARWGKFFLLRGGLLLQKTSIGFQDKIQSVSLRESPFDRRWKMASIAIDTSGAGVADHELKIELLDVEKARLEYEVLRQWNSLMTSQIIPPHPPCTHPKI